MAIALAIGLFSLCCGVGPTICGFIFGRSFSLASLLFLLYPPKYTGTRYWIIAAALYAMAKVFEFSDYALFSAGYLLSGHTLKHLAAAAACFAVLRCFQTRRLLT